jgi:hypothetical protein
MTISVRFPGVFDKAGFSSKLRLHEFGIGVYDSGEMIF